MRVILWILLVVTLANAQPYEPVEIWSREGAGDSSLYGSEILALGDQNDDGYNDWAVYAAGLGYAPAGSPNEPKVEFFHGGNPPSNDPYMVRVADRSTEISVRGARALGDLNGDGYVDWYIFTSYVGDPEQRHIYKIYFGGPGSHEEPDLILTSLWQSGYRGIGDFNGDGFDDLFFSSGTAAILYGGNPMDTIPDWRRSSNLGGVFAGDANGDRFSDFLSIAFDDDIDLFIGGENPDTLPAYHWDEYVSMVAILPDLNGDGMGDLAFGIAGHLEVRFGGSSIPATPNAVLNFPCSSPHVVVSAGDFNGDGYHDVAMATSYCSDSWYGKLTLHLGGSWLNPEPTFVVYGWTEPLNLIGIRTAVNLGDVNRDGVDDLAIGANDNVPRAGWRGKTVVLAGDTSLIADTENPRPELPNQLHVNVYPNPFNSETTILLNVPLYSPEVFLTVYNLLGQEVWQTTLRNVADRTRYDFHATGFSSGVYLLHVKTGSFTNTQKVVILH